MVETQAWKFLNNLSASKVRQLSPHVSLWMHQSGATLRCLHSRVNTLTKIVRKPSKATRLRDLVAGDSGFTLLETLAVMVIIGLLAAITVPQIAKWRDKAYITSLKTDARNIANAIEVYYVDNLTYPTTRTKFVALVASDVKLNPGNFSLPGNYGYYNNGPAGYSSFVFYVVSTKTDHFLVYYSDNSPPMSIVNRRYEGLG